MEKISRTLLSWASILDEQTRAQAVTASQLPFVFPHIALMPDAHLGKGATVGSVIPTERAVIPAAVGVDIGCGMLAVRTQLTRGELGAGGSLPALREAVERRVPLSAGTYNRRVSSTAVARVEELAADAAGRDFDPATYAANWALQLGTLGSGNHFIEVSIDELDRVWLFLHSGSRGVGNKIATHHIGVAQGLMRRYCISLPERDLAYLVEDTDEFWAYVRQMQWAQTFAALNRAEMMDRVVSCVEEHTGQQLLVQERIDCHHNYTEPERHFGRSVWLSRKGAIRAATGVRGLIPGSMGSRSFVVTGLGNRLALDSAPHGAGRVHSRTAARRLFTSEQLAGAMEGIEYRRTDAFLDEHPGAYKDIDVVMHDATELVRVEHTLRQVVNVKGD